MVCCEDKKDMEVMIDTEDYLRIYLDTQHERELLETDTISTNIDSERMLYVETSYDELFVAYDKRDVVVERMDGGGYLCTPMSRGTKKVVFVGNRERKCVNFAVSGVRESYMVYESTYAVEASASEIVKEEILSKLPEYSLREETVLLLYYEDLQSGFFEYIPSDITGTFTVLETGNYKLAGDALKMNLTLQCMEQDDFSSYKPFLITQDLTDTFRQLYSQEQIDMVMVTTSAERISRKYY